MIILKTDTNSLNKIMRKAPKPVLDDVIDNNKPHYNLVLCLILEKISNYESPDFFRLCRTLKNRNYRNRILKLLDVKEFIAKPLENKIREYI